MKQIVLILFFILICTLDYGQEINNIEPYEPIYDSLRSLRHDSLMNNDFFDFINKEIIRNQLKGNSKLPENYEEFKSRFLALKLNNEPLDIGLPKAKPGTPQLLDENYIKSLGFALSSPISFFYYNFSKVERSRRRVYELRHEKEQYAVIDTKINRHKIQYWTGLKEKDLDKFILFCDFSFNYMLTASEYDLILKVKEKFEEFKKISELNHVRDSL